MTRTRAGWAAMLTAAAVLTTAGDCDEPTKRDSYTCQAAEKQAADDPGNPVKRQARRDACT